MRKRLPILAALLSLALIAGACAESTEDTTTTTTTEAASPGTTAAQTTTTTEAAGPKTIIIGTTDTIASLDPGDAYSVHDWELIKNTGEGLLGWEPGELTLRTGLATDFPEVSDDGLTYTFTLRDGIQFGDGTELTASMYAESLNRLLTIGPDCPNGVANALATPFIESITAPDESTMVFQLTRPVAFFPQLTATATFMPAHPDTFPADECVLFPEAPIYGVGPWYISEYTQAEQTVLEPNPNYTGDLTPNVDRIIIRYFSDPQTMALAVQNGEIDVAWRLLGPELVAELGDISELSVGAIDGGAIRYLILNYAIAPMDDINVRKAVAAIIDRDELADVVYGGQVAPLYSMVPPGFLGATEIYDTLYASPDVDAALGFLADSGYDENNQLELELWYPPEHYGAATADWMALIEQQLEATGAIDVTLQAQEWSTYVTALTGGDAYPAGVLGWFFDFPDSSNYLEPFVFNGGLGTEVTDADNVPVNDQAQELLDLLDEASVETDLDARAALYEQVQEVYAELVVTLPLFFEAEHVVFPDYISVVSDTASPGTLGIGPNLEFYYSVLDTTK
jgi:peptide/nickel transport system substrate-binding protein